MFQLGSLGLHIKLFASHGINGQICRSQSAVSNTKRNFFFVGPTQRLSGHGWVTNAKKRLKKSGMFQDEKGVQTVWQDSIRGCDNSIMALLSSHGVVHFRAKMSKLPWSTWANWNPGTENPGSVYTEICPRCFWSCRIECRIECRTWFLLVLQYYKKLQE